MLLHWNGSRSRRTSFWTPLGGAACALVTWGILWAFSAAPAWGSEGDTQTLIFIGSSDVLIDGVDTSGTTLGARWGYEFHDNLLWTIGGSLGSTTGSKNVSGVNYNLSTDTTTLQSGLLYYFGRGGKQQLLVPFVGGGIAAINYDVDYRYPGSPTGKTSGTGPGGYAFAGVELWLARAITVIVSYDLEDYAISRQHGGSTDLETGGLMLALRLNLYSNG